MSECNDHWCEYYGKGNCKCDHCQKAENVPDRPELRVILQQRAIREMEDSQTINKDKGQER